MIARTYCTVSKGKFNANGITNGEYFLLYLQFIWEMIFYFSFSSSLYKKLCAERSCGIFVCTKRLKLVTRFPFEMAFSINVHLNTFDSGVHDSSQAVVYIEGKSNYYT